MITINLPRESRKIFRAEMCMLCRYGLPMDIHGRHYLLVKGERQLFGPCDALKEQ